MKTNKKFRHGLAALLITMLYTGNLYSQVMIGSDQLPQVFSLLEISSANQKGGLRLPHLTTAERTNLSDTYATTHPNLLKGLFIYNTTTNRIEYWNKKIWVSL